jgi:S-adenosylmethionine-diacylglycerol 3-amino-3-carboxypropyl transferase
LTGLGRSAGNDAPRPWGLAERFDRKVFDALYARSLVYNTCWEDPAVDRRALNLGPGDRVLVITSAGCNVLDYALTGVARVHAVDANPRQSALLELKLSGIRRLEFEDFFGLFGKGRHAGAGRLYRQALRADLSPFARDYWDRRIGWFNGSGPGASFYFHGLSGLVARGFRSYLSVRPGLRRGVHELLEARTLAEQRAIYDTRVHRHLWGRGLNWVLSRGVTMSLLGVPAPQKAEVERQHRDGVAGFVREAIEYVFRDLPLQSNYFWTLYLRGRYEAGCCPEYLKPANFAALKGGLAERIEVHTCTVTEFLRASDTPITRFVLLDHMDWMSSYLPEALLEEWRAILERASPGARIILRSAHRRPDYLDRLKVDGRPLKEILRFHDGLAMALQPLDRVHTYAGFHIADAPA